MGTSELPNTYFIFVYHARRKYRIRTALVLGFGAIALNLQQTIRDLSFSFGVRADYFCVG
jgi:hypothetical protein